MSSHVPNHLIYAWLARGHQDPDQAQAEWNDDLGVAMLPLGILIAAVRLNGDLVRAATGTDDPGQIAAKLEETLDGAVIYDRDVYYALINGHAGLIWDMEKAAPCLGDGVYLSVPVLRRTAGPGPHWVCRPRREGDLCRPDAVRKLIAAGLLALHPAEC
ncbi:hypothetical protein OG824_32070 [Streptomyces prunicolor]|uniref:hypothetical protein n=1 Tax=Streptomyces prunicolor TaxID=67348 RepID=UPI0022525292|nr:hypothetical protein [Streptomyces prunicolor]MCX5239849.1 hypothetical protein [Streptomyces prunicolor]